MDGEQRPGDWLCICDLSGFKCWASETVQTWNGLRVHRRFVGSETQRHPQELVRGRPDNQAAPWARPEPTDVFLSPGDVTQDDL
jgi:hypothetical protein